MAEVTLFSASKTGASFSPVIELGTDKTAVSLDDFPEPFINLKSPDLHEVYSKHYMPIWNFDATTSESHQHTAEVTNHPVENGVDITDHIQLKPFKLTLTGIVTNTPLAPGINSSATRIRELYDDLINLFESKQLLSVVTGLRRYTNMVITSVTVPRQAPNRQHIIPSVSMVQINTVEQAFVALESLGIPKKAKPKVDKTAEKTTKDPNSKEVTHYNTAKESFGDAVLRKIFGEDIQLNITENLAAGTPSRSLAGAVYPKDFTGSPADLSKLPPVALGGRFGGL